MTNLRNAKNYSIGLDIGTGSVGWAVIDEKGELYHFKGKPTWGSRIFPSAQTAASARAPRGQRRRYERRRQRLDLLQGFFAEEVSKVDPEFFNRLNHSYLVEADRDFNHPLFNGSDFTESDYYKRFPTIYHLRKYLMETDEPVDIRLVYLAFHNIVKHRGNFLHQDNPSLSAKNANMEQSVEAFVFALQDWFALQEVDCGVDQTKLQSILEDKQLSKRTKQEQLQASMGLDKSLQKTSKALSQAMVGYVADYAQVFFSDFEDGKFALSNDEKVEAFYSECPDEGMPLFDALRGVYSSLVLSGILKDANGGTISDCKVAEYNRYGADLKLLKSLVREFVPEKYSAFFRGATFPGSDDYDPAKAKGYTRYNLGPSKKGSGAKPMAYDDFKKEVVNLFKGTGADQDKRYASMMAAFEEESFLRRLKTSDNGSIPYQLHLEEMRAIIDNLKEQYPFLKQEEEKLCSLVSFRIPYYVGPLTTRNAAKDANGRNRFAWATRIEGKENEKIYPWNWDKIIDRNDSAEKFIHRMTGTCSYLQGKPVLPKCSLLYEEFCVLNELNGARWTQDGDDFRLFDFADKVGIVEELFRNGSVSYKKVADWMRRTRSHSNVRVKGGQGETGFESRLSSYIFFCKSVFQVDELPESWKPMIEEIILWNTLFEDRGILREKLQQKYGEDSATEIKLNADQIKTICRKRFTGWGRLSREFLTEIQVNTDNGKRNIMDVLWEGNPNNSGRSQSMVLMQILHDDRLGFQEKIDECNRKALAGGTGLQLEDLPGSPALRRAINQSLRIVDEIVGIAGCPPANIFIEVTREEDKKNKGQRTKKRYESLKEAIARLKEESPELWSKEVANNLKAHSHNDLDERLTLYFMQNGKSLYSGKPLDITRLSEYQVDHIIPQSYIKDDSFDNKALVLSGENQAKADSMLIDESIRRKMKSEWRSLYNAKLISEKKYNNLMRDHISPKQLKGFISRQLVETSQIVKLTSMFLEGKYEDTRVLPIKAGLSSTLRDKKGFAKCREINDYHHAHDALLACEIGRFVLLRHPKMFDEPIAYESAVRKFLQQEAESVRKGLMPGSAGFVISSFLRSSGFNKETGEIYGDYTWDAEFECERIRRFLNYKDCFISRMPEETSGAFWDATIYSPRGKKKPVLFIKNGLQPANYGGFSSVKYAYFSLCTVRNVKNGSLRYELVGVPVNRAKSIEAGASNIEDYLASAITKPNSEFVSVVRSKVPKYQLIDVSGFRFFITGGDDIRGAVQFAYSQNRTKDMLEILEVLNEDSAVCSSSALEQRLEMFDYYSQKYRQLSPRAAEKMTLDEKRDMFCALNEVDQASVLLALATVSNAASGSSKLDIPQIKVSEAGRIRLNIGKLLTDFAGDCCFIDQSVTGMFERRTKLEL